LVGTRPEAEPLEEAAALFRSGITVRAVAAQLGIARSSAGRLRQKVQEDGLLDSDEVSEADGGEDESGTRLGGVRCPDVPSA
jgi:hypothetical protein